jgi:hypothetical protein
VHQIGSLNTLERSRRKETFTMFTSSHKGRHLRYLAIWPDDYNPEATYPLVVMLHGFGASMFDLVFLAPALGTAGYIYLSPTHPYPLTWVWVGWALAGHHPATTLRLLMYRRQRLCCRAFSMRCFKPE